MEPDLPTYPKIWRHIWILPKGKRRTQPLFCIKSKMICIWDQNELWSYWENHLIVKLISIFSIFTLHISSWQEPKSAAQVFPKFLSRGARSFELSLLLSHWSDLEAESLPSLRLRDSPAALSADKLIRGPACFFSLYCLHWEAKVRCKHNLKISSNQVFKIMWVSRHDTF